MNLVSVATTCHAIDVPALVGPWSAHSAGQSSDSRLPSMSTMQSPVSSRRTAAR